MNKKANMPKIVEMPIGDVWSLRDVDESSQYYGREFKMNFSFISQPLIKMLVKRFVWEEPREGNITLSTANAYLTNMKTFIKFAEIQGYTTLILSNADVELYKSYLATSLSVNGTPFSRKTQKKNFDTLKAIIRFGQRKSMFHVVPRGEIFSGREYHNINKRPLIDYIPDPVVEQMLKALPNEENVYVKCGIRIMQGTGMRIGDLMLLKVGCNGTHPIDKAPTIRYFTHKRRKNKTCKVPAFVIEAVKELEEHTASIREKAPVDIKDKLFIYMQYPRGHIKHGNLTLVKESTFSKWLHDFCSNNQIKGSDGHVYQITNHQFRRSLATDMLSKGVSIKAISRYLTLHPSNVLRYYATVKDKELAAGFRGVVIGNVERIDEKVIPNASELEWFHENRHKGAAMNDGYCSKPFKDNGEICERLKSKWACYKCNRYITTLDHLELHKRNLAEIEDELKFNPYGEHYADHLRPVAALISQIINRLEGIKNDERC